MILNKISQAILLSGIVFLSACSEQAPSSNNTPQSSAPTASQAPSGPTLVNIDRQRLDIYTDFSLQSDLSHLSENQKAMVAKLIDASKISPLKPDMYSVCLNFIDSLSAFVALISIFEQCLHRIS